MLSAILKIKEKKLIETLKENKCELSLRGID
jgi:hypothetical protein